MEYDVALILWAAYIAVFIVILSRIILRPQREPASRLAWLIATIAVPVVGILAYLLLGESLHNYDLFGAAFIVLGIVLATVIRPRAVPAKA